jgi:hypothetical protein
VDNARNPTLGATRLAASVRAIRRIPALAALSVSPASASRNPCDARGRPTVALLLPLTGRTSAPAAQIRDGFMTAYYECPQPRAAAACLRHGRHSIADTDAQAQRQGATFIVGPLTREEGRRGAS